MRGVLQDLRAIGWDRLCDLDEETGKCILKLGYSAKHAFIFMHSHEHREFRLNYSFEKTSIAPDVLGFSSSDTSLLDAFRYACLFLSSHAAFMQIHDWIDANLLVVDKCKSYSGHRTCFLADQLVCFKIGSSGSVEPFPWNGCSLSIPSHLFCAESSECGVCFNVAIDAHAPLLATFDTTCASAACRRAYHRSCLLGWFRSDPSTASVFGMLQGACLYCGQQISIRQQ